MPLGFEITGFGITGFGSDQLLVDRCPEVL
jgi:hypothetical protein